MEQGRADTALPKRDPHFQILVHAVYLYKELLSLSIMVYLDLWCWRSLAKTFLQSQHKTDLPLHEKTA